MPDNKNLARDLIRDFIRDIRVARRFISEGQYIEDNARFERELILAIEILIPRRNNMKFDRFGWPVCLKKGVIDE